MPVKKRKRTNPFAAALIEGFAGSLGAKAAEHLAKKSLAKKKKKRKNSGLPSGVYIPVKVEGGKLKMKLPNRNSSTIAQARAIARQLGAK